MLFVPPNAWPRLAAVTINNNANRLQTSQACPLAAIMLAIAATMLTIKPRTSIVAATA